MHDRSIGKGIIAGAIGGIAASAVMLGFQRVWSAAAERTGRRDLKPGAEFDRHPDDTHQHPGDRRANSSEAAAQKLSRTLAGGALGPRGEKAAGLVAHFAYGAGMGALYGALAERLEQPRVQVGIAFGLAVFLFDQVFLPAAGLSERPDRIATATQVFGAANHVVYGSATEAVRAGLRRAM